MPIQRVLIANLRRVQAFDRNLTTAVGVDRIIDKYTEAVMFTPNAAERRAALDKVSRELFEHFSDDVLPQSRRIGVDNAIDVSRRVPKPVDLSNEAIRRRVLLESPLRDRQRLEIVRNAANQEADNLASRLTRYYLEPGENNREKITNLREIHKRLEERRTTYEKNRREFDDGARDTRPAKPNLDYMSELHENVKLDMRAQARRAGTDAEIRALVERGHSKFGWVAVNAGEACPDCRIRQGVILSIAEWDRVGRPGSRRTVCLDHCFCMLVPGETLTLSPGLTAGPKGGTGPMTNAALAAFFDAHRVK